MCGYCSRVKSPRAKCAHFFWLYGSPFARFDSGFNLSCYVRESIASQKESSPPDAREERAIPPEVQMMSYAPSLCVRAAGKRRDKLHDLVFAWTWCVTYRYWHGVNIYWVLCANPISFALSVVDVILCVVACAGECGVEWCCGAVTMSLPSWWVRRLWCGQLTHISYTRIPPASKSKETNIWYTDTINVYTCIYKYIHKYIHTYSHHCQRSLMVSCSFCVLLFRLTMIG